MTGGMALATVVPSNLAAQCHMGQAAARPCRANDHCGALDGDRAENAMTSSVQLHAPGEAFKPIEPERVLDQMHLQMHHGALQLVNAPAGGACVTLTLPAAAGPGQGPASG